MVTATRLCLVRHGETDWNAERRLQGHLDIPLNTVGERQARATAASLAAERFAAVYTSDLLRARQTAAAICAAGHPPPLADARLRERHYGLFQGLTYAEAETRHPQAYARFHAREPDFAFPGSGESLSAFAARIDAVLADLAHRHAGSQLLIVCHGGVLDIVHRLATGKALQPPRDFVIPNAALNWIVHDAQGWRLQAWAEQRHLDGARDELANA